MNATFSYTYEKHLFIVIYTFVLGYDVSHQECMYVNTTM